MARLTCLIPVTRLLTIHAIAHILRKLPKNKRTVTGGELNFAIRVWACCCCCFVMVDVYMEAKIQKTVWKQLRQVKRYQVGDAIHWQYNGEIRSFCIQTKVTTTCVFTAQNGSSPWYRCVMGGRGRVHMHTYIYMRACVRAHVRTCVKDFDGSFLLLKVY